MSEQKNYYAIIPANVRYDKSLTANAKLLYGEITALCNEKGFCWASNNYFAELYNVKPQAISKWIKQLESCGYVAIEYTRKGKEIVQRKVSINIDTYQQKDNKVSTKTYEGINKNVIRYQQKRKENNTCNNKVNNTINKHRYGEYKNVLLSDEDIEKLKIKFPDYLNKIKELDEGIELKGYKYKNHYLAILKWSEKNKPLDKKSDLNQNTIYTESLDKLFEGNEDLL